jgi:hypothetical protein
MKRIADADWTQSDDEYLQVQVPAVTKRNLGIKAAETRQPLRVIVLKALKAYGVTVPADAIFDRRGRKKP